MLTLDKIENDTRSKITGHFTTTKISINPQYIVSIRPPSGPWAVIREVNDQPCSRESVTEVRYSVGQQVETIVVLARYEDLVKEVANNKKRLLHG